MTSIVNGGIPCLYELVPNNKGIIFRINSQFVKANPNISKEDPRVQALMDKFGFKRFLGNFKGKRFGFEGVLKYRDMKAGFVEYQVVIPKIIKYRRCKLYHNDLYTDPSSGKKVCSICLGTMKIGTEDCYRANSILASISLLLNFLNNFEGSICSKLKQLVKIEMTDLSDLSFVTRVELSKELAERMRGYEERCKPMLSVAITMKKTWQNMGEVEGSSNNFRAYMRPLDFLLDIKLPGGFYLKYDWNQFSLVEHRDLGYYFTFSKNSIRHQFTMLSALAMLNHAFRKKLSLTS